MPRVLTVIPAKGRSRRIPGKNAALLAGKPLVVHAVEQAVASGVCGDVCVYTDDQVIAQMARDSGAEVPFLREGDVDDVTSVGEAALNMVLRLREQSRRDYDILCILLTTAPLRLPVDIVACYEMLVENSDLDATMSFKSAAMHPYWSWERELNGTMRPMFPEVCHLDRAEVSETYFVDGSVYFSRVDFFEKAGGNQFDGRVGGYVMPSERSVDIDTPLDLEFCEFLLSKRPAT
jgi:CMP-N-acetylneuraminic acid synthetase